MKSFFNKLTIFSLIIFSFSIVNVYANPKEYLAYSKGTTHGTEYLVDDGGEKIVYCYNRDYNEPDIPAEKTYYTRTESYLNSNDKLMDVYGKEKKEKIAAALVFGYPNDPSGLIEQCGISKDDARYITQQLIWDICSGNNGKFNSGTTGLYGYYDKLVDLSNVTKFEEGNLSLVGDFKFTERGDKYTTLNLSTKGSAGSFTITNLPKGMNVRDWNTDELLNNKPIKVGREFYLESPIKPTPELKLKFKFNYQDVKFYFYEHLKGGRKSQEKYNKPFQSLIRAELENKTQEKEYEISIGGQLHPLFKVILRKKDATNDSLLKGAMFNLQNQKGVNIKENLVTNDKGEIEIDDLDIGDYQFVETKAPNGYELDKTPVKFSVNKQQKSIINVEKKDMPINLSKLKISKVDSESGNPLKGAKFKIFSTKDTKKPLKLTYSSSNGMYEFNNNGNSILKANSNDSSFTINNLNYGDYILREVKAPKGYKLSNDIYIHIASDESYFKVGELGDKHVLKMDPKLKLYKIDVEDEKCDVLPNTGGSGFLIERTIAIFIIVINFFLLINLLLKRKFKIN